MGEDFAIFLTSFQKYEKFVLDTNNTLILLERYNDDYNKTGKISSENVNDMTEKFFSFVKDVVKIVYDDVSGSLFKSFIKSVFEAS